MKRILRAAALAALGAASAFAARPAQAHAHFGVFLGFPGFVYGEPYAYYPEPVYYPPPVYYTAPPTYYEPAPGTAAAPAGYTCYTTPYVCPLTEPHPVGAPCSCPAYGGGSVTGSVR